MTDEYNIELIYDRMLKLIAQGADKNGNNNNRIDKDEWNSIMDAVSDEIKKLDEYKEMVDFFKSQGSTEEGENKQNVERKEIKVEPEKLYRSSIDLDNAIKNAKDEGTLNDNAVYYLTEYYTTGKKYKITVMSDGTYKKELLENVQFQLDKSNNAPELKNSKQKTFAKNINGEIKAGRIKTLDDLRTYVITEPLYQQLSIKIDDYIKIAKAQPHKTVDDIKKLKKSLKDEIKKDKDIPDNVRKKIVNAIVYTFVLENIQTAYDDINKEYAEYAKNNEVNYTDAAKDIKQQFANKIKDKNKFYADAYNIFVKNLYNEDAQIEIRSDIYEKYFADDAKIGDQEWEDKSTKKKKIRKELITEHKKDINGTEDENYEKQVKKENKSVIKITARHNKAMNRQNELKDITFDEIKRGLGNELTDKIEGYLSQYCPRKGDSYDLSDLSKAILKAAGADYLINQSDDPEISEITKVRRELSKLSGFPDETDTDRLTDHQIKKLIRFCEIELQKNDHTPTIANAAGGAVAGGAAGGASKLVSNALAKNLEITVNHKPIIVNISEEITADDLQALVKILEDNNFNVTVDNGVNGTISTVIEILQNPDNIKILAPKLMEGVVGGIIKGAWAGLIVGAISTLIFGNPHDEKACIDNSDYDISSDIYINKTKFEEYLIRNNKYEKVKTILEWFPENENGDWDHAQYFNFLRAISGNQTTNCEELLGALLSTREEDIEPLLQEPVRGQKYTKTITTLGETKTYELSKGDILENAHKYDWVDIVGMYDCLNNGNMPEQKAIKIMKVIQAIEPDKLEPQGQYNLDEIVKIVDAAFEKPSYKPDWIYINSKLETDFPCVDKNKLRNVLYATYLGDKESHKLIVPAKLYRNDGDPCEKTTDPVQLQRRYEDAQAVGDDIKNNVSITTKYTVTTSGTEESKWWIRSKPDESWKLVKENEYNKASDLEVLTDESDGLPDWDTQ
ncbi:MAG: hypothetical protein MJ230_02425 [bacterium]|nr:hypothetical protein [bacterium]